ncbi:MAG: hypothetical protein ACRD0U_17035, partial [Acidimicrobiales bacterium]
MTDHATMPAGVREVLDRRLAPLSERCREALGAAAVIGREFDVGLLGIVMGFAHDELSDLLDEAVGGRVVVDLGFDRFTFVHDLFRQALYDGLGRAKRVRLHRGVGEALEALHDEGLEPYLSELAHHFLAATSIGDVPKAVEYGRRAGERAARLLAFEEAADLFQRSLAVLPDKALTIERAELLLAFGDARWRAQDMVGARAALVNAAEAARVIDNPETFARAALAYACGLGGNQPLARADRTLIALREEAGDRLPPHDSVLRCRVQARLAAELYLTDEVDHRLALSAEAVAMARRIGDPSALAAALYGRQIAVLGPDGRDEREAAAEEIIALAHDADDPELELWGHLFRVWARQEKCLPVAAELATCARLAEHLRLPGYRAEVALRQAVFAVVAGQFDEADRLLTLVHAGASTNPFAASSLIALMTLTSLLRGPITELEPMVIGVVAEYPDKPMWRAALATLYAELGRGEDTRRELAVLADRNFDFPRDGLWLYAMWFVAFACFVSGDVRSAQALHPLVLPHVDQAPVAAFGSMATAVGLFDATCGRFDAALEALEQGRSRNKAMGNHGFALWTRREMAAVLLARDGPGDREQAADTLDDVIDHFHRLGFTGILPRAEMLLALARPGERAPMAGELRRVGSRWEFTYDGITAVAGGAKGLDDLALLLASPGREIAAVDLVGGVVTADTGEVLDRQALQQYRARLADLEDDIAEAEIRGDADGAERARSEREAIARELGSA